MPINVLVGDQFTTDSDLWFFFISDVASGHVDRQVGVPSIDNDIGENAVSNCHERWTVVLNCNTGVMFFSFSKQSKSGRRTDHCLGFFLALALALARLASLTRCAHKQRA